MGPYYRQTSQGMGGFFETLYEQPLLIVLLVTVIAGVGFFMWRKKQNS